MSKNRVSSRSRSTPILNPRDWQRMKERRSATCVESMKTRGLINQKSQILEETKDKNLTPMIAPGELSTKSACWTVLNMFVGLGLLSKPYSLAKGGWVSIPILAFLTWIANICGKLLVKCYDTPKCRTSTSYADVVDHVLGYSGAIFLIIAVVLEYVAGVCICMLFIWGNLETLMPEISRIYIVTISTAMVLPTIWLIKLSDASLLTLLGFMSTILIVGTIVYLWASNGELEEVDMKNTVGPDIPLSAGIFMLSLSGHAGLPQVYREMSKPEEFDWVLDISFFIMFLIYITTGIGGYMIYGMSSEIIISTSMLKNPGGILPKIVAWLVILKNYFTINPFVSILCDSSEIIMGIDHSVVKQRVFRSFAFLSSAGLSYLAFDALPFVESFASATFTMLTSFILPAILFVQLNKEAKSWKMQYTGIFIIVLGFVMMGVLTYGAVNSLRYPDPKEE